MNHIMTGRKDMDIQLMDEDNQKLENLLNLSLQATQEERNRSRNLETGYDEVSRQWELIVKYHGDLRQAASEEIVIEELLAGYAIVTIPERLIQAFSRLEEVEYIEVPKRLYFQQVDGRRDICLTGVGVVGNPPNASGSFANMYVAGMRSSGLNLVGNGVLVGVADSGIDYYNSEFLTADGKSRILALWDQTLQPDVEKGWLPPEGFARGVLFTREMLNNSLAEGTQMSRDTSGHGTAVASIAAGSGIGVASGSDLIIVKLGVPLPDSFPKTTELMRAMTFMVRYAERENKPLAVNLSFGNVYGNHLGTSLLERFMDNVSEAGRNVICAGSGNEAASNGHYAGIITEEKKQISWSVGNYEPSLNLQLWKSYADVIQIALVAPNGERRELPMDQIGTQRINISGITVLVYLGEPLPYSDVQEYYFDFIAKEGYLPTGIWNLEITGEEIKNGAVSLYLPSYSARSADTGFFQSEPVGTLTIPSTSSRMITVGAYDPVYQSYAPFSGRGYTVSGGNTASAQFINSVIKPEIAAPGVNVLAAVAGGGYGGFTGTSFAAPYVTGSAALLMEWGEGVIIRLLLFSKKIVNHFLDFSIWQ
ncbi:MAG: S8 family serine peptidase [Lachnospiraceae bacterium]|nr:S8 family serine peptidase [Lachnospiraceae bacterium]